MTGATGDTVVLAPYAAHDATSRGHRHPEPAPEYRGEYQRDEMRDLGLLQGGAPLWFGSEFWPAGAPVFLPGGPGPSGHNTNALPLTGL